MSGVQLHSATPSASASNVPAGSSRPVGCPSKVYSRRFDGWRPPSSDVYSSATSSRCRRSEEHTDELQSLMRISYAVFCLKKNTDANEDTNHTKSQYQYSRQYHKRK